MCVFCVFVSLSVCQSVSQSVRLSVCLSVYQSVRLSVCQPLSLSVCQSVCLSINLSVCLSVCQSLSLSVCQSLSLSVCLSVCQSVSQTVHLSVTNCFFNLFVSLCINYVAINVCHKWPHSANSHSEISTQHPQNTDPIPRRHFAVPINMQRHENGWLCPTSLAVQRFTLHLPSVFVFQRALFNVCTDKTSSTITGCNCQPVAESTP